MVLTNSVKILLNEHFYSRVISISNLRWTSLKMLQASESTLIPEWSTEIALLFVTDFISLAIVVLNKWSLLKIPAVDHIQHLSSAGTALTP